MATNTGGFWKGKFGRGLATVADAFIPGNAYNSTTSRWNPATLKTGIAGVVAGQLVPGGEALVQTGAKSGLFGSEFARDLRNEGIYNTLADQYGDFRNSLKQNFQVEIGGNPSVSVGQPQPVSTGGGLFGGAGGVTNMPAVVSTPEAGPWSGLGTSTGNLFNGGSLGSWASPAPSGGWVSGGGGARGAFSTGGYASDAARQASIAATQQGLYEAANRSTNNRQMTDAYF